MSNRDLIPKLTDVREESFCENCALGKMHVIPFATGNLTSKNVNTGEFFHSDLCGPITPQSLGGANYFLVFKDDATSYKHIYFIKHKSDTTERFIEFDQLIFNKFNRHMKRLRVDNGKEYFNERRLKYMTSYGITVEPTAPHTPQQNAKSERENRTIVEAARTLLISSGLPKFQWAEACRKSVITLNRSLVAKDKYSITPYEA